jgi:hypothetical protein
MTRYQAEFSPQAWQNDYAIPVDPQGETTWDVTEFVEKILDEGLYRGTEIKREYAREWLDATLERGNDHDDVLWQDENAPEWVRNWSGPFDTYLRVVAAEETRKLDSDVLPEGLHVISDILAGQLLVVDAQEHVWLTLHDSGRGDPAAWRETILSRVLDALEIDDDPQARRED